MRSQLLTLPRGVVVEVQQIIGSASFVLLSCVEVVNFRLEDLILLLVQRLHVVEPLDLAVESLLPPLVVLRLNLLEFLRPHSLVCHCEVLVEPVLL